MDFLGLSKDDRRNYVARMLDYHPGQPQTWDMDLIDRIIDRAIKAAERTLFDDVRSLLHH